MIGTLCTTRIKLAESARDSQLRSGIIKPTLSVSSKNREKDIWQRRKEKMKTGVGKKRRYEGQEGTDLTLKEEIETTFSNFRFSDSIY